MIDTLNNPNSLTGYPSIKEPVGGQLCASCIHNHIQIQIFTASGEPATSVLFNDAVDFEAFLMEVIAGICREERMQHDQYWEGA